MTTLETSPERTRPQLTARQVGALIMGEVAAVSTGLHITPTLENELNMPTVRAGIVALALTVGMVVGVAKLVKKYV